MSYSSQKVFTFFLLVIASGCAHSQSAPQPKLPQNNDLDIIVHNARTLREARWGLDAVIIAGEKPKQCGKFSAFQEIVITKSDGNLQAPGAIIFSNRNYTLEMEPERYEIYEGGKLKPRKVAFSLTDPQGRQYLNTYLQGNWPAITEQEWVRMQTIAAQLASDAEKCFSAQ
jgi:hypothetical protein